ncbi:MAG: sensor histidine kinase [Elusimicrobiaceae bacterium]|nr:sensor histidine kinase [Elusimicrobiaceae bacterium]
MKPTKKAIVSGKLPIPYVIKERATDIGFTGHYVCVYLLDKYGNYSYIYGLHNIFDKYFKESIKTNDIHRYARETAFTGKSVSYQWFESKYVPTFFRTLIIPLSSEAGKISSLLFVISQLDGLFVRGDKMILAEKTGQSFVRIIMQAREEEKRLVTSAIHDQLGNFSIRTNALIEILKEDITKKSLKDALKSLSALEGAIKDSVHSMKEIITSLRPLQLDSVGLDASIKELLEKISQTETIKIKYSYKIKDKTVLSKDTKLVLYRAVQEALSNTIKYAKAKKLTVELKEDKSYLYLTVKDDGKGFKLQAHRSVKSLGLEGMKENIASLKGTMKLTSKLGKGTTISIRCPKFNYKR